MSTCWNAGYQHFNILSLRWQNGQKSSKDELNGVKIEKQKFFFSRPDIPVIYSFLLIFCNIWFSETMNEGFLLSVNHYHQYFKEIRLQTIHSYISGFHVLKWVIKNIEVSHGTIIFEIYLYKETKFLCWIYFFLLFTVILLFSFMYVYF